MQNDRLEFYGGKLGNFIPIIIALVFVAFAALHQAKIEGYVMAFFIAIIISVLFAKNEKLYGKAIVKGLTKPMFAVISLAVLFAAIAGSLVSKSGLIQTLAVYVIQMGFTGKVFVASTFFITCIIAFSTGTSVGTYFVIGPILYPVGCMVGADPTFLIGSIVAGAAFGDNLAPISDTTIASATTQRMDLGGVVRSRLKYSIPVAIIAFILYLTLGSNNDVSSDLGKYMSMQPSPKTLLMLVTPIMIIVMCIKRKHLITAISYGIIAGVVVGLCSGIFKPTDLLQYPAPFKAEGILLSAIQGSLSTIALLMAIFPLLGIMEMSGAIESIANGINSFARGKVSAEVTIVGSIGLISIVTGVISVAILAVGELVNDLGEKYDLCGYRRANLMDCSGVTFGFLVPWTVHAIVPAMITSKTPIAVSPAVIPFHNFYSLTMLVMLIFAIITGYGRVTKPRKNQQSSENIYNI